MRRTLYLSMACLLSALSVVGQTGSRDLNPIEKQKLQLPELPSSQARASMLRSNGSVDYTKGTFIVNEDWYGHQNSSVNFLSEDGTWTYNAFQKENPGHELGCTSQFGTIYGDLLYIVSKQSKDGAASVEGSRLAVIDAKTMQVKKEFQTINSAGADGRSFLGVDLTKGYIGTSNGIYVFHTGYDEKTGKYDENQMSIEASAIEGTTGISSSDLYHSQIGTMIRVGKYVFAVHQTKGLLVIDPKEDKVINTILKPEEDSNHGLGSIVLSKDGNLWASVTFELTGTGATMPYMWKVNPYTLTTQKVDIPTTDGIEEIPNSWYAWTADGFCASTKENKIYWKGQGSGSWFTGYKIFCYDIDKDSFYQVFDFTKLDKGDWRLYGTGFRIDPVDDNMYCFLYHEFLNPEHELAVIKTDGRGDTNGTMVGRYPYEKVNYWFPALPVFPDNMAPTITDGLPSEITFSAENTKYSKSMDEIIEDGDNMISAVVTTIVNPNPELISAEVINNTLTIAPIVEEVQEAKEIQLKLSFNSNGKLVNKDVLVKLTTSSTAPFEFKEKEITLDGKGKSLALTISGLAGEQASWSSSHPEIINVSNDGIVTSVAYGTAEIRATSKTRPEMSDVCIVTVKRPAMILQTPTVEMYENESKSLIALSNGVESATEEIEWISSNEKVAKVGASTIPGSPHPMIFAYTEGITELSGKIKSTVTGQELSVTKCLVTVRPFVAMTEIKLFGESGEELQEGTPIQLEVNKRTTLIAKSYPENATDKTIKWSSSDKSLFTVEDGVITVCGAGTATITAQSEDGKVSASCEVSCSFKVEKVAFTNRVNGFKKAGSSLKIPISFYPAISNTLEIKKENVKIESQEGTLSWTVKSVSNTEIVLRATPSNAYGKAILSATITGVETGQAFGDPIQCEVLVSKWATSLVLEENTCFLKQGEKYQIKPTVDYGSLTEVEQAEKDILYSSADESIATVDKSGLVTAVGSGKTIVKAYLSDGSNGSAFKGECVVCVGSQPVTEVKFKQKEFTIKVNESLNLLDQVSVLPENADFKSITWKVSSSGFNIKDGIGSSNFIGVYEITAQSEDGQASDKCTVHVDGDVPLKGFSVEPKDLSIDISVSTFDRDALLNMLKINFNPTNASVLFGSVPAIRSIEFESSNPEVLEQESRTKYNVKKVGTSKLTLTYTTYGYEDEMFVHVTDKSKGVLGIVLEASQRVAAIGESFKLAYTLLKDPDFKGEIDESVTWSSSNEACASVDPKTGEILALGDGETVIRVSSDTGGFVAACTLSVGKGIVKVTGVSLNQDRLELTVGHAVQLVAAVTPSDAKTKTVNWSSDNRFVADVDKDGNVLASSEGTATITATTLDGGYTATCKVIVSAEPEKPGANVTGVSLNASSLSLNKGEEAVLAAVVSPSSAINKSVTWSSSDATVATVTNDGTVKAGIAGVATITVTTDEGGYTATCEVTVIDPDLEKPVVEVKDSTAILTFPKVPEATFYEVSVYKYVNEIPVLFGVYTVDAEGNILTGLMSELRSGEQEKIKVSIPELDGSSEYIVKVTAIKEGDGRQEILGTFYSEPFSTSGPVANEAIGVGEAMIYYYEGRLHLNNLEGYSCYIVNMNGAILDLFKISGINESHPIQYSRGAYIIVVVKDNDRMSKTIVVK